MVMSALIFMEALYQLFVNPWVAVLLARNCELHSQELIGLPPEIDSSLASCSMALHTRESLAGVLLEEMCPASSSLHDMRLISQNTSMLMICKRML